MIYYMIYADYDGKYTKKESSEYDALYCSFCTVYNRDYFIFLSKLHLKQVIMGCLAKKPLDKQVLGEFLACADIHAKSCRIVEISLKQLEDLVYVSKMEDLGDCYNTIYAMYQVGLRTIRAVDSNGLIHTYSKAEINKRVKNTTSQEMLTEEINRIYDKRNPKEFLAHPTHYILTNSDHTMCYTVLDILLSALYNKNRLQTRSFILINLSKHTYGYDIIDSIYKLSQGGTVVIEIDDECSTDNSSYAFNSQAIDSLNLIAPFIENNKNKTLTIFMLNDRAKNLKNRIYDFCEMPFVEIEETMVKNTQAKKVLNVIAQQYDVEITDSLEDTIKKNELYSASDLCQLAKNWFDNRVYNELYPAYNTNITKKKIETKPQGSGYDELMNMIGLKSVKTLINKAINYRNVQKVMEERKLITTQNSFNMVFTGNPGTAKTTVARLFAKIMKDNGILSNGELIEVGRADLVGKYVGWTADLVKEKFKQAKGNVLFIDEAYSLLDGDHNTFGVEAINTIVQEMENHREDTIVIFAGYPKEMEQFLNQNPGMKSRIAFHIEFDNYNEEELYQIAELMASKMALKLGKGVKELLIPAFKQAMGNKTFGNGRYVRNLLETANLNLCNRVASKDLTHVDNSELTTLTVEDFEIPKIEENKRMGFLG